MKVEQFTKVMCLENRQDKSSNIYSINAKFNKQ